MGYVLVVTVMLFLPGLSGAQCLTTRAPNPPFIPTMAPANVVFIPSREAAGIMAGIDIPGAGCWEVTAQYGGPGGQSPLDLGRIR